MAESGAEGAGEGQNATPSTSRRYTPAAEMKTVIQKVDGSQDGVISNKLAKHKILKFFGCGTKSCTQSRDSLQLPGITTEDVISRDQSSMQNELLPRLPDHITLHHIVTKLPWITIPSLCAVSHNWRQAIQTQQVYEARVQFQSTETLILIYDHEYKRKSKKLVIATITLYSMREKAFFKVPSIPHFKFGFPGSCQVIAMDGKIYIMGGWVTTSGWTTLRMIKTTVSKDVYVLDLTMHNGWKKCATMQEERQGFRCAVLHGKIYVFGGYDERYFPISRSEVYDPKEDKWSSMEPTISHGEPIYHIAAVGDELFLQSAYSSRIVWQVYHPAKNEWRVMEPSNPIRNHGAMFSVEGTLYGMNRDGIHAHGIHVLDISTDSWRKVHSVSWDGMGLPVGDQETVYPLCILHVNNELLVMAEVESRVRVTCPVSCNCLILSEGFGSQIKQMKWERLPYGPCQDLFSPNYRKSCMCPIQL